MFREIMEWAGLIAPQNVDLALKATAYNEGLAGRFDNRFAKGSTEWKSWREGLRAAESDSAMCI